MGLYKHGKSLILLLYLCVYLLVAVFFSYKHIRNIPKQKKTFSVFTKPHLNRVRRIRGSSREFV